MKAKQIKVFKSGSCNNGQVEREANAWIIDEKIDAISIQSGYNFWYGYFCNVTYEIIVK